MRQRKPPGSQTPKVWRTEERSEHGQVRHGEFGLVIETLLPPVPAAVEHHPVVVSRFAYGLSEPVENTEASNQPLVQEHFDLLPGTIIRNLELQRLI